LQKSGSTSFPKTVDLQRLNDFLYTLHTAFPLMECIIISRLILNIKIIFHLSSFV